MYFLLKYVLLPVLFTLTQVILLLITSTFTRVQIQSNLGTTAYILLFAYSPTHSIHLELLPDQTTDNLSKVSSDLLQEGDVHGKFTRTMVKFLFQLRNGPVI